MPLPDYRGGDPATLFTIRAQARTQAISRDQEGTNQDREWRQDVATNVRVDCRQVE